MIRENDGHVGSTTDPPGGSTVIKAHSRTRVVRTVVIVLGWVCIVSEAAVAMHEFADVYNIYQIVFVPDTKTPTLYLSKWGEGYFALQSC